MTLTKTTDGSTLTIAIDGRLDTTTAPQLEAEISQSIDGMEKICLDFGRLEYISSAGLRVLLGTQKKMAKQHGELVIRNAGDTVKEVFEITGFVDILTIE